MARNVGKPAASTHVTATRHAKDQRVNIPTVELEAFAEDDEKRPATLLYPRDPSLDPQLVWKGKDEQDRQDLAVPAVPIYIQEQIEPRAIIEDLRAQTAAVRDAQLDLFSDFNGLPFEERVDFYRHPMHWTNRLILGDSLAVMASLAEKEGLKGQVQCIYLDPPYGIKFGSNWQVSTRKRDVKDGKAEDASRQPEQVRAFRDTWELGIHSYLSYLRDRLTIARDLLTESGSIFVQIGDENVHLVRAVLDEVFGAGRLVSQIAFTKAPGGLESVTALPSRLDYLLWYSRGDRPKLRLLFQAREDAIKAGFNMLELSDGTVRGLTDDERRDLGRQPAGARLFRPISLTKPGPGSKYQIRVGGVDFDSGNRWWGSPKESVERLVALGRVRVFGRTLRFMSYHEDFPYRPLDTLWEGLAGATDPTYVVQTNPDVPARCILMTTDPGDLVLDPTCGGGTTAYVAEQWGRRWITIDTSRVALALARTRLMSARYPYYLLADSPEGRRKEGELAGQPVLGGATEGDIRQGFVYERARHITLSSIANNPEIEPTSTRSKIDAAIARHADTELLYDRPYTDPKIVRVAGPFTVESLSPHRVVADGPEDESAAAQAPIEESGRYVETILDNLRASGVDNRIKNERLRFETLEPYPGTWLQAEGIYQEGERSKRAAIALGPEYGTVGAELVRDSAVEAVNAGFDLLVVCGFAFDAAAGEQASKLGRLTVLRANMNPDLRMAEDLLKKTRSGNLFTVFGEPDVDVRSAGDGQLQVEIRGLDVYDPTTGEIRSNSTADIACWFIDTDYNGRAFFVRHAYFCGGDEPYDKLRRALRAEIDEAAWASLYATVSRPFPRPPTGRIAVKVTNHYGDEVLKVYGV